MEADGMLAKKELFIRFIKFIRPIDLVVVITSVVAMYLFRLRDGFQLNPIWQLQRDSGGLMGTQIFPLITDLDGNGLKELIIASGDKIEIFSFHSDEFDDEHDVERGEKDGDTTSSVLFHLHQKATLSYGEILERQKDTTPSYPIAMNAGCITRLQKGICSQVLAIAWSDWTVTLLSHQLKVLWRSKPMDIKFEPKLQITEMSIFVAAGNKSVFGEDGLIIVGGVLNLKDHKTSHGSEHDHSQRVQMNQTAEEISRERAGVEPRKDDTHTFPHLLNPALAKFVGHFTSYALDAGTGKIKWKHEPGDFEIKSEEKKEEENSLHFKLRLKKKALHRGEVHWRKYSQSFLKHLPFSWAHRTDTIISLGEFRRSVLKPSKRPESHILEQLMVLAKTGLPKSHPETKTQDLNAVIIRHNRGIEVLDLGKGSPICSLPLDARHSTLADVNGDENIDLARFRVYEVDSNTFCYLVVSDAFVTSSVLFNSSVCSPSQVVDLFGDVISSSNEKIRSLPPLLTKTVQRSFGILRHVLGHGLSRHHVGMDTIVLTSSGKLTAFEPSGRFLWQVDTGITWSLTESFTPNMKAVSLSLDGTQDGVVILGSHELVVVSLVDGSILTSHSLPCVPTQPLVLGDINNDISDEFLVRCNDRYLAFNLERYNRIGLTLLVYSGVTCVVCLVLFTIKFIEREEFPFEALDYALKALRYFPLQGTGL